MTQAALRTCTVSSASTSLVPERPGQSRALIATLLDDDPVAAEAAAARLAILGRPSVRNLLLAFPGASSAQAVRVLGVLERIGDPLGLPVLADAIRDQRDDVAEAAVTALAELLTASRDEVATSALDHVSNVALDTARPRRVRLAAVRALVALDLEVVAPLRAQLLTDSDPDVRAAAGLPQQPEATDNTDGPPPDGTSSLAIVRAAADGRFPAEPETLRQALLAAEAADAGLSELHRVIQRLREVERGSAAAAGWRTARAAAHQVLARRGSRLAVYDLRETVSELGTATPVGVLSALQALGDAAALESLVDAWSMTDDEWFKSQLAAIFAAIAQREGLTRRHSVVRKLTQRAAPAVDALWPKRP